MPTYKEVSKIIDEYIIQRESALRSKISVMQQGLYDDVILNFLDELKKNGGELDSAALVDLERRLKKYGINNHPEVILEIIEGAKGLGNLNVMYFSTLFDDFAKLQLIKAQTEKLFNKQLGLKEDGTLKAGGFLDRIITDKTVQRAIIKEAKIAVAGGFDFQTTREAFKKIIIGGNGDNGLIQKHYTTFTSDLLSIINNNNNKIFADELGLKHFFYAGGLIKTSRPFCIHRNGKIFTNEQALDWKNDPEIRKMYAGNISDYDPFTLPGGYGCRHTLNYITPDLAQGFTRENNKKAAERNHNFKYRNNL